MVNNMYNLKEVKELYLDMCDTSKNQYIYKLNFINELAGYYQDNFKELENLTKWEIMSETYFDRTVHNIYEEFLKSDNYNLYNFIEENVKFNEKVGNYE